MDWGEIIGYTGTALTFAAWGMRDAVALRVFGVASSVAFLAFGLLSATWPVVATELALLPLNGWRLWQLTRGRGGDAEDGCMWLMVHSREVRLQSGAPIVRAGDAARQLTVVVKHGAAEATFVGDARPFRRAVESRTIRAERDMVVARIDLAALEAASARDPLLAQRLVRLAIERPVEANAPVRWAA